MKTKSIRFSSILLVILLGSFTAVSAQSRQKNAKSQKVRRNSKIENIQLFNGKDLSNWLFYLKDQSVDPASVFTVQNGVIHITGNPFGYMRTKDTYSDYRLHVEWRYPVEATNSGVFIHATPPDAIWIKCFECQLAAGNAGDFICMNGTDMNERKDKTKGVVKKLAASSEKSVGEWNIMEVVARENTLEVFINGVQQNKGTAISSTSGHICLQSEGKDIEFKNVYLTNLKKSGRR
jgi:Domain of Unknown Function (DUF1080)